MPPTTFWGNQKQPLTLARHRQAFELFELKAQLQDQELSRPKSPDGGFFSSFDFFWEALETDFR